MAASYPQTLRLLVKKGAKALMDLPESKAAIRPAPGKWSPKEVVGHLIDSASNNHQRFVRAQFKDDLVFDGYDQDAWVASQQYQTHDWPTLITLWQSFNLHLASVMENTPEAIRMQLRNPHNLDRIAWQVVPANQPATLDYFMADYVGHLHHHLRQILGTDWVPNP